MSNLRFNIYSNWEEKYIKNDCILEAIIEPGHRLSDDEVRRYFKIDRGHRHWERAHNPSRLKRYVFDKCIIPDSDSYKIEVSV